MLQICCRGFKYLTNCNVALYCFVNHIFRFETDNSCLWLNYCFLHLLVASSGDASQQPEIYDFDHIHFDSNIMRPVAILYGALGTDCFRGFHVTLTQAAKEVCYCGLEVFCLYVLYMDFLLLKNFDFSFFLH